jgi:hypothetical protein
MQELCLAGGIYFISLSESTRPFVDQFLHLILQFEYISGRGSKRLLRPGEEYESARKKNKTASIPASGSVQGGLDDNSPASTPGPTMTTSSSIAFITSQVDDALSEIPSSPFTAGTAGSIASFGVANHHPTHPLMASSRTSLEGTSDSSSSPSSSNSDVEDDAKAENGHNGVTNAMIIS